MTRRRWIADTWTETTAALTGDQALHLARVLRAEPGIVCDIVAGGFVWKASVTSVAEDEVRFDLLSEIESEAALPVTLLVSIFKFDRMEWALEKATELGVHRIVPVIARRTEKHLALAAPKRLERWRRIVREASRQSRRSDVPEVHEVAALKVALQNVEAESDAPVLRIVLSEQEQSASLKRAIEDALAARAKTPLIQIAVGPEGGWAPEELTLLDAQSWKPVTLGPNILRAETAAIAALSVIAACLTTDAQPIG
jgi:16S rRNA (uracil1498-N3)-methyltransferase